MANARINIFENISLVHDIATNNINGGNLHIHAVYIPGSISFNNIVLLGSGTLGNTASTGGASYSFGLYSRTGSTLSLANSASGSISLSQTQSYISWLTLATSTTQDITPGIWWLAIIGTTSNTGSYRLYVNSSLINFGGDFDGAPSNLPIRGKYSATTNALPATMNTNQISKEGGTSDNIKQIHPYILISA